MKTYNVTLIKGEPTSDAWNAAPKAMVDVMCNPEFPSPYQTEAQLLYNDRALFVHMKTTERNLRACKNQRNDEVCEDSCMEFFISPDNDDIRYFNFEINPIGTLLLFVYNRRIEMIPTTDDARIFNIKSITSNDGWEIFYEIPFSFMMGLFLAYLYIKFNSLLPCIILHFINNFISCIFMFLYETISTEAYGVIVNIYDISTLLIGIICSVLLVYKVKKEIKSENNHTLLNGKDFGATVVFSVPFILFIAIFLFQTITGILTYYYS